MNFVDEQHIVRFQIGEHRRQVARALKDRPRGALHRNAHFVGDDIGQRGLAQAWRAEDQGMVEGLVATARSLDEQRHLLAHHRLADVFLQAQRTDCAVLDLFTVTSGGGNQAVGLDHLVIIPLRLRRISSSLLRLALPSMAEMALLASCGL